MKCKKIHNKLIFFLDGDLSSNEEKQIKDHLTECPDCAAFADHLKKTLNVIQSEKSPEVNPFFYTRLKAKIEDQAAASQKLHSWISLEKILQPVFFTLLLTAGIYAGYKVAEPENAQVDQLSYNEDQIIPYLDEMQVETIETFLMDE